MKQNKDDYKVVPYPKMRRLEAVMLRSFQRKPLIHGLLEVDVTRARAFLREHKAKTGEALSFTAFLITCLAKAVDEHKAVQAFRQGSKHLERTARQLSRWRPRVLRCHESRTQEPSRCFPCPLMGLHD